MLFESIILDSQLQAMYSYYLPLDHDLYGIGQDISPSSRTQTRHAYNQFDNYWHFYTRTFCFRRNGSLLPKSTKVPKRYLHWNTYVKYQGRSPCNLQTPSIKTLAFWYLLGGTDVNYQGMPLSSPPHPHISMTLRHFGIYREVQMWGVRGGPLLPHGHTVPGHAGHRTARQGTKNQGGQEKVKSHIHP